MTVPDYIEPLIALRVWNSQGDALYSVQSVVRWPVDAPLVARCNVTTHGPAPAASCTCGIYGLAWPVGGRRERRFPLAGNGVLGFVALWGRVMEGPRGWRAERGLPVSLVTGSFYDGFWSGPGNGDRAEKVAAVYGLPVGGSLGEAFEMACQGVRGQQVAS